MIIHRPPRWFRKLYGPMNWKADATDKSIYLTFDDGPTPEITEWVLDQLKQYEAKATFFCIGRNVERHPEIYERIIAEGHAVGNHTYSHLKGFSVSTEEYVNDIHLAADLIDSKLFRPPYGRINRKQIRAVKELGYKFFMWDVLSEDYNRKKKPAQCMQYVTRNVTPGSLIVFHDSVKASGNMQAILPKILKHYQTSGYQFKRIE